MKISVSTLFFRFSSQESSESSSNESEIQMISPFSILRCAETFQAKNSSLVLGIELFHHVRILTHDENRVVKTFDTFLRETVLIKNLS